MAVAARQIDQAVAGIEKMDRGGIGFETVEDVVSLKPLIRGLKTMDQIDLLIKVFQKCTFTLPEEVCAELQEANRRLAQGFGSPGVQTTTFTSGKKVDPIPEDIVSFLMSMGQNETRHAQPPWKGGEIAHRDCIHPPIVFSFWGDCEEDSSLDGRVTLQFWGEKGPSKSLDQVLAVAKLQELPPIVRTE